MTEQEIFTKFEGAQKKVCFIDNLTYANSAFAATTDGDAVFINSRIVDALSLKEGERLLCYVLPNYEDKRSSCKFRALKVERIGENQHVDLSSSEPQGQSYFEAEVKILEALDEQGPLTTSDLAEIIEVDSTTTSNICRALHRTGNICRADVYRQAGQGRASLVVWAKHPSDFSLDIE